jgi:uncharacterized protein (TIGR00369 family)
MSMEAEKSEFERLNLEDLYRLPLHRFLGLQEKNFDAANNCIRFEMQPDLVGNFHFNILHGGVIASIFDVLGAFILIKNDIWRIKVESGKSKNKIKGGTINLRVDYLKPGRGTRFVASGSILHHGNKIAVVQGELRNEFDELIAVGTGTYLVG